MVVFDFLIKVRKILNEKCLMFNVSWQNTVYRIYAKYSDRNVGTASGDQDQTVPAWIHRPFSLQSFTKQSIAKYSLYNSVFCSSAQDGRRYLNNVPKYFMVNTVNPFEVILIKHLGLWRTFCWEFHRDRPWTLRESSLVERLVNHWVTWHIRNIFGDDIVIVFFFLGLMICYGGWGWGGVGGTGRGGKWLTDFQGIS